MWSTPRHPPKPSGPRDERESREPVERGRRGRRRLQNVTTVSAHPLVRISELPGVEKAVQESRTAVDRLLGHRALRRHGSTVTLEAALRGAWASATLEGARLPLEDLRAGTAEDPRALGALRISGELGPLAATWSKAPQQALARMHALAAADAVSSSELGRPRSEGEDATDPENLGLLPSAREAAGRLAALTGLLEAGSAVPAVVLGAVVHGELQVLRPFGWGSGLVARAAERLTLLERGLDPKALVPVELGHGHDRQEYRRALRGYLSGTPEGVAAWVVHCAAAVRTGAQESLAACEALHRG